METNPAVEQAEAAVVAAVAALAAVLDGRDAAAAGTADIGRAGFGPAEVPDAADAGPGTGAGPDAARGPGPAVGLDDELQRVADRALDVLAGVARSEARLAALKAQAAAVFAEATKLLNPPAASPQEVTAQERSVVAEVGCALAIGDRAAGALLFESFALTTSLPRTLGALQEGTLSWQHARTMVEQTVGLNPAAATAMEAHFLDPDAPNRAKGGPAGEMPAYRFKHKARAWRERHHPDSIEKRHARGVADRRVEWSPDQDGMAWFSAYLPADQATALWNRTTAIARGLQGPGEKRTLSQLRADVITTAGLTSGTGSTSSTECTSGPDHGDGDDGGGIAPGTRCGSNPAGSGLAAAPPPRAQVLVTVPVFALLGLSDEPAVLDGHGPIPASMARDLVAIGAESFHRVLVDPRDGAPLEIGRTSYRVTKAMRNWLRMRDGKCPFPGCSNSSLDNEADHLLAWHQGGTTGISNLGQPCPKHHKLRHTSGWRPTPATKDEPPGWISPSGRHYKSEHQDWEPPHWPPGIYRYPESFLDDADAFPPDDPMWDDFYAVPPVLPPDPFPEWHLWLDESLSVP